MKKAILICFISFISSKTFCQTDETFTEEKSSDWIKISVPPAPVTHSPLHTRTNRVTAAPEKKEPASQPATQPKSSDAFKKTNSEVKRFKKGNGN
ncbi:MAG: hypothetical protein ACTHMD_11525 [Flavisolibacter sp.]